MRVEQVVRVSPVVDGLVELGRLWVFIILRLCSL
jgi:hypothetical protein